MADGGQAGTSLAPPGGAGPRGTLERMALVGENLRETPGIAALVFRELADKKIRMISQGASEINLTFVIEEDEVPDVIRRLHKTFFSELDPEVFA